MNKLTEKERHYQRLDQLRDAHPDIYSLSHSDALVRGWRDMWATSEMSLEAGLAKLCLLLCEHKEKLTESLLEQLSCRPRIFGVDLAKEGSERTAVYPAGDLRSWTTYGKQVDDDPDGIDQRREQNRMLWGMADAMPTADKPKKATDPLGLSGPYGYSYPVTQEDEKLEEAADRLSQMLFPTEGGHIDAKEEPQGEEPEEPQEKLRDKFKMRF